ncbi:MAG: hypothetical protein OXE04_05625 [bacterium]|nr:hypothetical protein [bacterium]
MAPAAKSSEGAAASINITRFGGDARVNSWPQLVNVSGNPSSSAADDSPADSACIGVLGVDESSSFPHAEATRPTTRSNEIARSLKSGNFMGFFTGFLSRALSHSVVFGCV